MERASPVPTGESLRPIFVAQKASSNSRWSESYLLLRRSIRALGG